jgi:hypothetical protein
MFYCFFIFGVTEIDLERVVGVDDVWRTRPPAVKMVGCHQEKSVALGYINILDRYVKKETQTLPKTEQGFTFDWYIETGKPSGAFALHKGFICFVPAITPADFMQDYQSKLTKLVDSYTQAFPDDVSPISPPDQATAERVTPPGEWNKKPWDQIQKSLNWPTTVTSPIEIHHCHAVNFKIPRASAMEELVKQTLGITGNVRCTRAINDPQKGEDFRETLATYIIEIDRKKEFFVKQHPQHYNAAGKLDHTWSEAKFKSFKKIHEEVDTRPILDDSFQVHFCLPIGLWTIGGICLEVLPMASGGPMPTALNQIKGPELQRREKKCLIWRSLGKALGLIHKKLGKFNKDSKELSVRQLDWQMKNICWDDVRRVFTVIDLDCVGKYPVNDLRLIVENEVMLITRSHTPPFQKTDGTIVTPSSKFIREEYAQVYIEGYLEAFDDDKVLQGILLSAIQHQPGHFKDLLLPESIDRFHLPGKVTMRSE